MLVVWDESKRATNLRTHSIDVVDVGARYDFVRADISASYDGRFKATGFLDDALLTVVVKPLGMEAISIISARPASRKERRAYDRRQASPRPDDL